MDALVKLSGMIWPKGRRTKGFSATRPIADVEPQRAVGTERTKHAGQSNSAREWQPWRWKVSDGGLCKVWENATG